MSDPAIDVYDLRHLQSDPAPHTEVVDGRTLQRDIQDIDTIVLHQTAVPHYGVTRAQVERAGGDEDRAQRWRALEIACHAMAYGEGWVCLAHRIRSYVHHGHRLNGRSLGLEVEGLYPGLAGGDVWGGATPTELTELTVAAARQAVLALVRDVRALGGEIRYIAAHRQSSADRRADPGEELWRRVAVEYATPELGLRRHPDWTIGDGLPLPAAWDPLASADY